MDKQNKEQFIAKWKDNFYETKAVMKSNFVQLLDHTTDGKKNLVGHVCVVCEKFFHGKLGGSQRSHKCSKETFKFSKNQKSSVRKAALLMISQDLVPFSTTYKEGFLQYTKTILQVGAELGTNVIRSLTTETLRELVPHPTTLSNDVNTINSNKAELFAYIRRQSEKSGIAVMLDGTTKSYHYTGIVVSFIDDNWNFKRILLDFISGHDKGSSAAAYSVTKLNDFLDEFGSDILDMNGIVTDEAASMKAAFSATDKHILCGCHLLNTISKHVFQLYAADEKTMPSLNRKLKNIGALMAKLKAVITVIRQRIHLRHKLSIALHQSNNTRWLSVVTSLESFLNLTEEDHAKIRDELQQHDVLSKYLDLLQAKEDLTTIYNILAPTKPLLRSLECDYSPTLHKVLPVFAKMFDIFNDVDDSNNEVEKSLKEAGRLALASKVEVLHKYHYFAVMLDPNEKRNFKKWLLPDRKGSRKTIKSCIDDLKIDLALFCHANGITLEVPQTESSTSEYAEFIEPSLSSSLDEVVKNEVDRYILDMEIFNGSILCYWKKARNYPLLSQYSRHILSIPASSSSVERVFSVANKIDSKTRPQLSQETISSLVLANAITKFVKETNV